jgi:hypothetical protein
MPLKNAGFFDFVILTNITTAKSGNTPTAMPMTTALAMYSSGLKHLAQF